MTLGTRARAITQATNARKQSKHKQLHARTNTRADANLVDEREEGKTDGDKEETCVSITAQQAVRSSVH